MLSKVIYIYLKKKFSVYRNWLGANARNGFCLRWLQCSDTSWESVMLRRSCSLLHLWANCSQPSSQWHVLTLALPGFSCSFRPSRPVRAGLQSPRGIDVSEKGAWGNSCPPAACGLRRCPKPVRLCLGREQKCQRPHPRSCCAQQVSVSAQAGISAALRTLDSRNASC